MSECQLRDVLLDVAVILNICIYENNMIEINITNIINIINIINITLHPAGVNAIIKGNRKLSPVERKIN